MVSVALGLARFALIKMLYPLPIIQLQALCGMRYSRSIVESRAEMKNSQTSDVRISL